VLLGGAIGSVIGLVVGYTGGWLDMVVMRLVDMLMAFPGLILALAIVTALGPGLRNIIIAVGIGFIPNFARIVRGTVISAKQNLYVDAAHAIGCSSSRIMFRHILPNVAAPIIVFTTLIIPSNILFEAALSFLGVGVPDSTPSWGAMLAGAGDAFTYAAWLMIFPGLFLFMTTLAFNLVGDGLRDALDPRTSA
jgi:ABC-type dipeptide/oligopeptide/nickel transport system permease subunit